jgi:small nuclear ribonucleoprotein G
MIQFWFITETLLSTMAPKFQKGPDLKRFMVRLSICVFLLVPHAPMHGLLAPDCCPVSHSYISPFLLLSQDKRLKFSLNGNRQVIGKLRGFDAFLNVVLEEAEQANDSNEYLGTIVIRGNSIIHFEGIERV